MLLFKKNSSFKNLPFSFNYIKKADSHADRRLLIIFERQLHLPIFGTSFQVNVIAAVSLLSILFCKNRFFYAEIKNYHSKTFKIVLRKNY